MTIKSVIFFSASIARWKVEDGLRPLDGSIVTCGSIWQWQSHLALGFEELFCENSKKIRFLLWPW